MTLIRLHRAAVAVLAVTALLTGCTSASDSKADPAASSSPSPTPTANADTRPTYSAVGTGLSFQLPDTPLVYDYSGFDNDGMAQVGSTYWQKCWIPEADVSTTIDLTAYSDVEARSAEGRAFLAGFALARENEGNGSVKLEDVRTSHVQGFEATYGTLTYTTARTDHNIRTEPVQVAGAGWGLVIEVNLDSVYTRHTKSAVRSMQALLVEVLSYVDFGGASGGGGATT